MIASGLLVNSDRQPIAKAPVDLFYPLVIDSGKVLASVQIASTSTDGEGRFFLKALNSAVLKKYSRSNDGWVNLDLLAGGRSLYIYVGVARKFVKGWIGTDDTGGSVDLGTLVLAPGAPGVLSGKTSLLAVATQSCKEKILKQYKSASISTIVGELHVGRGTASFTYGLPSAGVTGAAADSSIGVAVSGGQNNVWSASGLSHVGTSSSVFVPLVWSGSSGYHRTLRSTFKFTKLWVDDSCYGLRYEIKAVRWNDVAGATTVIPNGYSSCSAGNQGSYSSPFTRQSGPAYTYPNGADITSAFGIPMTLKARSGYSTHVRARWIFGTQNGPLCGDTGSATVSTRIYAGP